jgi:PepB aminopeptidase
MQVYLNPAPASAIWGESNLVSLTEAGVQVHVKEDAPHRLRKIQEAARRIYKLGMPEISLSGTWDLAAQWAFYQGFSNAKNAKKLHFAALSQQEQSELNARVKVTDWVKRMINLPPNDKPPVTLAKEAIHFLESIAPGKITHKLIVGDELLQHGFIGIHSVGRGSVNPPCMAIIDYIPEGNATVDTVLVGKGVCFDSGGYSLKASVNMVSMKHDMGGAATTTGALALAILRELNKRVQLILCCVENLVAGNAYKLGDILTYKNGVSVEILNTDAEGRLILADGLIQAQEANPRQVIDAATLTGAVVTALGQDYAGVFSLNPAMLEKALIAGREEGELTWPMPLETWHRDATPSTIADCGNSRPIPGGGPGGASNAAGFLSRFVGNVENYLHFDIAGNNYYENETAIWPAGATGNSVRTIARMLSE